MLTTIALIISSTTSVACIIIAVQKAENAAYAQERLCVVINDMNADKRELWEENDRLRQRAKLAEEALQSAREALSIGNAAKEASHE